MFRALPLLASCAFSGAWAALQVQPTFQTVGPVSRPLPLSATNSSKWSRLYASKAQHDHAKRQIRIRRVMVEKLMQLEARTAVDGDFQVLFLHSRWYSAQPDIQQRILDEVLKSKAAQAARAEGKWRVIITSTSHTGGDMKRPHEHHDNTPHVQLYSPLHLTPIVADFRWSEAEFVELGQSVAVLWRLGVSGTFNVSKSPRRDPLPVCCNARAHILSSSLTTVTGKPPPPWLSSCTRPWYHLLSSSSVSTTLGQLDAGGRQVVREDFKQYSYALKDRPSPGSNDPPRQASVLLDPCPLRTPDSVPAHIA
ncbi:uncharacterized protein PHACADRAFT_189351 [Phanerochaete carnosa HHB-10118-sp]|uniref:Uncharacterized protein n=1 Tax=Phanerochaete carnosa (strain HHB-10118-sp) TaxID=650164 RepID=K5XB90_PHACS|nr:uncharacterized protein PHACADRAFT_189351 [Phanerochaete carnosa HHB-10118-sp]EKM60217.1 hypothetical protein PHACADRAFT_189351 [Phanerochaete carnosa HHB-10118-sp]